MSGPMTGKTVLITGATAGIGKATALELARQGAVVAVVGRNADKTRAVAAETAAPAARVVTVSSGAQAMGRIDFDTLQGERGYSGQRAYNQSKLANVLFSYELARRLEGTGITSNALHPGVVRTDFGKEDPLLRALTPVVRPFMPTPAKGAATSVHLATSHEVADTTGGYYAKSRPKHGNKLSYDREPADRLRDVSKRLTGLLTPRT